MHGKRIHVKCSIDDVRNLEAKALSCRKVYTRDRSIRFRNYVMGLCRQRQKRGIFELLENEIRLPRFTWLYKSSKLYRLVKIIQEATRLLAVHHWLVEKGVDCDRRHQYKTPSFFKATCLALRYRLPFYDEYWVLEC